MSKRGYNRIKNIERILQVFLLKTLLENIHAREILMQNQYSSVVKDAVQEHKLQTALVMRVSPHLILGACSPVSRPSSWGLPTNARATEHCTLLSTCSTIGYFF